MKRIYIYLLLCNPLYLSAYILNTTLDNIWYATVSNKKPSALQPLPKQTDINLGRINGILFDYEQTDHPRYYFPIKDPDYKFKNEEPIIMIQGNPDSPRIRIDYKNFELQPSYTLDHETRKILLAKDQNFLPIPSMQEAKSAAAAGAGAGAGPGPERKTAAAGAEQSTEQQLMARVRELEQKVRTLEAANKNLRNENEALKKALEGDVVSGLV